MKRCANINLEYVNNNNDIYKLIKKNYKLGWFKQINIRTNSMDHDFIFMFYKTQKNRAQVNIWIMIYSYCINQIYQKR